MNTMRPFSRRGCCRAISRVASIVLVALALSSLASCNSKSEISQAADDGNLEKVKALLKEHPELAREANNYNDTPLHYAANKDIAELLLANGANVNATDSFDNTPLHLAATFGRKDVVEVLLAHGASVNPVTKFTNETPLQCAASNNHNDIVELLRQNGGH